MSNNHCPIIWFELHQSIRGFAMKESRLHDSMSSPNGPTDTEKDYSTH
jgi:hypothetical protein